MKSNTCMHPLVSLSVPAVPHTSRRTEVFSIRWYHHSIGHSIKGTRMAVFVEAPLCIPSSEKGFLMTEERMQNEEVVSFSYKRPAKASVYARIGFARLCVCVVCGCIYFCVWDLSMNSMLVTCLGVCLGVCIKECVSSGLQAMANTVVMDSSGASAVFEVQGQCGLVW